MIEGYPKPKSLLTERDLSVLSDYNRVLASVDQLVAEYGTANQVFSELGKSGLNLMIRNSSESAYSELVSLRPKLDSPGMAVLHNTGVNELCDESAQLVSISIASIFGYATKTDRKLEQIAWPIKYDPDSTVVRTFSQSLGEAAFHTDTQYFEHPEEYFGLFCIEADELGKGTNELITAGEIAKRYKLTYGKDGFGVLRQKYPFKVPSVFTKTGSDSDIEVVWAPIFSGESAIRYRKDTINGALEVTGVQISDAQHEALGRIEKIIDEVEPSSYHLQPGDAILVNNLKLLHARTAFDNPDRFLYRVRMTENEV